MKQPTPSLPWASIVSAVAGVLYGASPIDLIPDLLPLLGLLDDALIVPAAFLVAAIQFVRFRKQRRAQVIDVPSVTDATK